MSASRKHRRAQAPAQRPSPPSRGQILPISLVLAGLTVAVYAAVRSHTFLHFDDTTYVIENGAVRAGLTWDGLRWALGASYAGNWHPLTWLSHMADVQVFGMDAGWHHLTNLAFHVATTLLIFRLSVRMTGAVVASAFVAALFALHPTHVESVAWIAERKDVLSTFWWVLAISAYVSTVRQPNVWRQAAVVVCFALALMSKPMVVTLPFVLLLLDVWPLERWRGLTERGTTGAFALIKEKGLLFLLAAASATVTFIVQRQAGAVQSLDRLPLGLRLAKIPVAYVQYLLMTIWPVNLAPLYPFPASIPVWQWAGSTAILVAVSIWAIRSWRTQPYLLVGWSWFLGTLVPVIGVVQIGSPPFSDRYIYVPAIGLYVMAVWSVRRLAAARPALSRPLVAAGLTVILTFAILTFRQVAYWKDNVTLWEHAVAVTGDNYRAQTNLGFALADSGQKARAIEVYREALRLNPNYPAAHNYLGLALSDLGDRDQAAAEFGEALRLLPRFAEAYNNLGLTRVAQNRYDDAISAFSNALRVNPGFAQARNNLAIAYATTGDYGRAIPEFEQAVKQNPASPESRINLATALAGGGRPAEAIPQFEAAARLGGDPVKVHHAWGSVLMDMGNLTDAIAHFQIVLAKDARFAPAVHDIGRALVLTGRADDGLRALQFAVQLQPGDADYHHDLGAALAGKGRIPEAIAEMRAALQIDPAHVEAKEALRKLTGK